MLAFLYAVTLGLAVGTSSRPMAAITGACAIMVLACFSLFSGNIDMGLWSINVLAAIVGYNAGLGAVLVVAVRREMAAG